jgi:hypothetical protein
MYQVLFLEIWAALSPVLMELRFYCGRGGEQSGRLGNILADQQVVQVLSEW